MPRARVSLLLLVPCLTASLAVSQCNPNPSGDPARIDPRTIAVYPLNIAIDSDLDGRRDVIRVSDFDGDGRLEIVDDLQAAMDLLDDTGGKLLAIEPGTYLPPPTCPVGSACWCRLMPHFNAYGTSCYPGDHDPRSHALLQLPSDTTVRCAGRFDTVLALWEYGDPAAPDAGYAAIGNRDYAAGNRNLTVEQCGWRGGGRIAPYQMGWQFIARRGLDFHNVEDALIRGNYASYFYHAGIFVESSRRVTIRDNVLERDSGYGNALGNAATQSSIYIHNDPFAPASSDLLIEGNTLLDPGGTAISLRNDYQNSGKLIERVEIRDNRIYSHGTGSCIMLRATRDVQIHDHYCQGTLFGFQLDAYASAYGLGNSNQNVRIDGLTLVGIVAPSGSSALYLAPYHSDVSFKNVLVDGTTGGSNADCMGVRPPFRHVTVEDFTLRNCGGNGIQFYANAVDPSINVVGRTPDEALVLEHGRIHDVDVVNARDWSTRSGIRFSSAGARFLTLRDLTIDGVTGHGIELAPGMRLDESTLDRIDISRVPPGFQGMGTKAELGAPACGAALKDAWVIVSDARDVWDCDLSGASGATTTRCRCEDGSWRRVTNHLPGHMISLGGGSVAATTFSNLHLHETGSETPSFAVRLYGGSGVPYVGNLFQNILIRDLLEGETYGIALEPGSADLSNHFQSIHCEGSAAAHCVDGLPPGGEVLP